MYLQFFILNFSVFLFFARIPVLFGFLPFLCTLFLVYTNILEQKRIARQEENLFTIKIFLNTRILHTKTIKYHKQTITCH